MPRVKRIKKHPATAAGRPAGRSLGPALRRIKAFLRLARSGAGITLPEQLCCPLEQGKDRVRRTLERRITRATTERAGAVASR
jgi:hypothetical protein